MRKHKLRSRHLDGTFELSSKENLRHSGGSATANTVWGGEDDGSSAQKRSKEIVKLVSTMVTSDNVGSKNKSVKKLASVKHNWGLFCKCKRKSHGRQ